MSISYSENPNEKNYRILLLEDSPNDVYLTRLLFRKIAPIVSVDNKNDYLAILKAPILKFDLIISDVKVPDFSEFEALKIAKSLVPNTPFIYLSGSMNDTELSECLKLGAHDYVQKDRPSRLEHVVKKILKIEEGAE
jgi:CheY-like chemotaxis protein